MSVEGWKLRRLDEIGEICSGSTPSTNNLSYWDGDITWVTPNDLSKLNTPYLITSSKKITQQGLKSCSAQIVPIGSIILSSRAPIGYLAISLVDCCTNQGCKSFNLNPEYDSEFVYYNLKYNINKIKNLGEGTTFAEISKTALSKIQISFLENKQEQTQIATILSTIDRAIEQTEALITKQQRIKTGLMQDLLTKGIDENGNIRSEETHEFKDSPLGRIPVEWDCKDIITIAYVTKLAGFEFTNYFNYSIGGEIIALRALNIKNEKLDLTDIQTIPKKVSDILPRSKINRNDILITYIGAYIGDVLRIEDNEKFHLAPNIAKIVSKDGVYPQFLEIALRTHYLQRQIKNLTATTATPSLTMTQIRSLLVAIPRNQSEQKVITEHISRITKVIDENASRLAKLKLQKTGLMQDLLTGKVRVTDLLNQKTAVN